ncbi:MAG: hypothetical protein AB1458_05630 [Bacteroidota bacterium]
MAISKRYLTIILTAIALTFAAQSRAQICDSIASLCAKHLSTTYVSDGQVYRTLLVNDQTAEFRTTFYGGTTYRICACSGMTDGNLIFTIRDQDGNVLFSSKDYKNAPYWDFKITSTLDCTIEATLNQETAQSGCAVLLIGFKQ